MVGTVSAGRAGRHAFIFRCPAFRRVFSVLMTRVIASVALGACGASDGGASGYPEGTIAAILAADDRFDTPHEDHRARHATCRP
jgi:hypothetical protein